ncbi:MAG: hypothetical protein H0U78_04690 [Rickettsiaceae bacterium]|nr:hypothetical protein [Rickettsiaceae bacterium]
MKTEKTSTTSPDLKQFVKTGFAIPDHAKHSELQDALTWVNEALTKPGAISKVVTQLKELIPFKASPFALAKMAGEVLREKQLELKLKLVTAHIPPRESDISGGTSYVMSADEPPKAEKEDEKLLKRATAEVITETVVTDTAATDVSIIQPIEVAIISFISMDGQAEKVWIPFPYNHDAPRVAVTGDNMHYHSECDLAVY